MAVLITGGAGYIGSHTCTELLEAGREIIVADRPEHAPVIERLRTVFGRNVTFHPLDPLDRRGLERIFGQYGIEAVIHFAGIRPLMEHQRAHLPIAWTVNLCDVMQRHGVRRLVFSSSAAVYGRPRQTPVPETAPLGAANRYGRTMLMIEEILHDLYEADRKWSIVLLRNFNPAGAHPSGWIDAEALRDGRKRDGDGCGGTMDGGRDGVRTGEESGDARAGGGIGGETGIANASARIALPESARTGEAGAAREPAANGHQPCAACDAGTIGSDPDDRDQPHLFPRLMRIAARRRGELPIYGGDYPTRDGTCVRDYVHVKDLARAHLKALDKVASETGIDAFNLGSGVGYTVLEVVAAFEKASGVEIPRRIVERRPGDAPAICADPSKAQRELGWRAELGLDRMCEDALKWLRRRMAGPDPGARVSLGAGGMAG